MSSSTLKKVPKSASTTGTPFADAENHTFIRVWEMIEFVNANNPGEISFSEGPRRAQQYFSFVNAENHTIIRVEVRHPFRKS